jgi:Bacterial pre-peptidase C-terminal domain
MQAKKIGNTFNTFQRSLEMSTLSGNQNRSGSLMKTDKTDFYRFTLSGKSSASFTLNNLKANADLELFNSNKALVAASRRGGKQDEQIAADLDAGTYYLKVSGKNGKTRYNLSSNAAAKQARFRVSLSGFTVNNETIDDWQEYDGKRDEVFIMSQSQLRSFAGANLGTQSTKSRVMGDQTRPDRILAGTGKPGFWEWVNKRGNVKDGGLQTGDSFPSATPWQRNTDFTADSVPTVLWEGNLASGQNTALITPTIWEYDTIDPWGDLLNRGAEVIKDTDLGKVVTQVTDIADSIWNGGVPNASWGIDQNALFKSGRELFGESALGTNVVMRSNDNKNHRPIGMKSIGSNTFGFDPKVLPLSYELADKLSKTNLSGKGAGVISLRYADDSAEFAGDYTLYLKVEQVPG